MTPSKSILVATDLSERAALALERGMLLAREQRIPLALLHVVGTPEETDHLPHWQQACYESFLPTMLQRSAEELERLAGALPGGSDLQVETVTTSGKVFVSILRQAEAKGAGLIVVGSHGSHLSTLFLGTTAEKIVRKGRHPVLVVKKKGTEPYRRVVVAVDFSDASRGATLKALELAPRAEVHLIHAYEIWGVGRLGLGGLEGSQLEQYHRQAAAKASEELEAFVRDLGLGPGRVETHVRHGHPASVIPLFARDRRADLVATGTQGRSGLPYILLGSVAEHILREVDCDVLTVRPEKFRFELP